MEAGLLETLGKIAGLGGIALGVLLLVFRDVVSGSVLQAMSKQNAYRVVRLTTVCAFVVALAGLGAWVYVETADDASMRTEGAQSPIVKDTGGNVDLSVTGPSGDQPQPPDAPEDEERERPAVETRGDQSPIVSGTKGNVTIDIGAQQSDK